MPPRSATSGQVAGIVLLALFTLGTETLPGRLSAAGGAAWLCPLLAGAAVLPPVLLRNRRPLRKRSRPSARLRPASARLPAVLLLLWGLAATAEQARRVGLRLSDDLRGSPLLLTAALLVLAAWMATGGPAALGRACRIFAMAVGLAFFFIVLFGLPGLRWDRILLWDAADLRALPRGAAVTAETLSVGLYALVLLEAPGPEEERQGPGRLAALFPLLALGTLLVTGRLGPGLAERVENPFFQMVSGLGFQGAFQRLEELVSALWLLGDLALLALLLLALRRLLSCGIGRKETTVMGWLTAAAVLVFVLCQTLWGSGSESTVSTAGSLAAGAVLIAWKAMENFFENPKKGA